jgi:hypothetical protein
MGLMDGNFGLATLAEFHARLFSMRLALPLTLFLAIRAVAQSAPTIPDNLKPPAGATLILTLHATGDQVYTCDGSAWTLAHPDARLFDDQGRQVGTHFAGPTWEYTDHSRVIGKPIANAAPDPDSVPWLLVQAKDHQGEGVMQKVAFIQRLYTKGGKAPAAGCNSNQKGQETRTHYSAAYLFYSAP